MSFTKILGSGISTETNLHVGVLSATKYIGDGSELLNVASTSGIGIQSGGSSVGSGITFLNFIGVGNTFALRGDVLDISISSGSNGIVGINTAGISTFNNLDVGGINASGVVTASSFDGNLTGNADTATYATSAGIATNATSANTATYATSAGIATNAQGLTGSPNIVVESVTGTTASFSGNVSIGGTLTYEDVTNIDSVGLITARSGINVSAGGIDVTGTLNVSGVSTFQDDVTFTSATTGLGVFYDRSADTLKLLEDSSDKTKLILGDDSTYTSYIEMYHDGGNSGIGYINYRGSNKMLLSGNHIAFFNRSRSEEMLKAIENNGVFLYYDNSLKFQTTSTGAKVTGDISATGGTNAIGIQSGGQNISTGIITALNFVGAGNSLSINGSTVDISISGGGGGDTSTTTHLIWLFGGG